MPTLIVRPIRLDEAGSYRERKRFIRLLKRLRDLSTTKDETAALEVFDEADALLVARLKTDDGSPVEALLDELSANQFDQLLSAVAFEGGVGEVNALPSTGGTEGSQEPNRQTG
jgi:hypothetical protein